MNPGDIAQALGQVPEKRLALLELARRCAGQDGTLDIEQAVPLAAEIATAAEEARCYVSQTQRLRWALDRLMNGR